MILRPLALVALLSLAAALASCSSAAADDADDDAAPPPSCTPGGDGTYTSTLYDDLDRYCMVEIRNGELSPRSPAVIPYELTTPSFSDYAIKRRTVWVPPGTTATYRADDVFEFPIGTILTKSFGFPKNPADSNGAGGVRWVETRVLVRGASEWTAVAYVWNDEQTAARKQAGGRVDAIDVHTTDGSVEHASYLVPSMQQCKKCHGEGTSTSIVPIGPRASALERNDQLAQWTRAGILSGAPTAAATPLPAWDDASAPVDVRARQYLAANCAYCHSPKGEARTTGLFLGFVETDPARLGRCKSPIAAGAATAGLGFDVVPGAPDSSILLHRMIATEPSIAMPEIGRSVAHTEGVQLVRAWIAGMPGDCSTKK